MASGGNWRYACVTRAQTIARGTRMIDLAIDGRLPRIAPRSRVDIVVMIDGAPAVRGYDCIPAPNGRIRITVTAGEEDGRRFMWALVEGAALRMTVPRPASGAPGQADCRSGVPRAFPFSILTVNDAIVLGSEGRTAANRPIVANSSIV